MKYFFYLWIFLFLTGCITRKEVLAQVWLHGAIPEELCNKYPELKQYGIFRRLNDDQNGKPQWEFLPYCEKDGIKYVERYLGFNSEKFYEILNAELPEKNGSSD